MIPISSKAEEFLQRVRSAKTTAARLEQEMNDLRRQWFQLSILQWGFPRGEENPGRQRAREIKTMFRMANDAYLEITALPWRFSVLASHLPEREGELLRRYYLDGMTWEKAFEGLCSDRNGRQRGRGLRDRARQHFDEAYQKNNE